jgi:aminoglycoside phosphotransferase (APT) family kinase protein
MEDKIEAWVEENRDNLGIADSSFQLTELTKGESNHVYKIETDEDMIVKASDMVVRTSLEVSDDRIGRESKVLDVLAEEGIDRVPRKIYFEDSEFLGQPVLAQTFIGDQDIEIGDMNHEQKDNFAEMLANLHSISPESFNEAFDEDEPEKVSMEYELEGNFEKYSREPFEEYVEKVDKVDERVKSLFEKQKRLFDEMIESEGFLPWRMTHGDPSNNVRASKDEIFMIDWELSRPGVPRFELVYMFRHNNMDEEAREEFLELYRQYRSTSDFADRKAEKWEKFLAFNDMIWAAKRKERVKDMDKDAEEYEKMFEKRLTELENMWETQ